MTTLSLLRRGPRRPDGSRLPRTARVGAAAAFGVCLVLASVACGSPSSGTPDAGRAPDTSATTAPATTTAPAAPTTTAPPRVETRTVTQTVSIPFSTRHVNDSTLLKGQTRVRTPGVNGSRTLTYEVTLTDGVQTARRLVSSVVTRQPVTQVVAVGTKAASNCDPNYTPCVPIASDVDCLGGGGNGPAYVKGPVKVIGTDIYKLDYDHDGWGCD